MSRREFFERALLLLGSATAAEALLASCSPQVVANPATATPVPPAATATTAPTATRVPPPPTVAPTTAPTTAPTAAGTRPPQPTPAPFTPPAASAIPGYVAPSAVDASDISFQSGDFKMLGHLAKPKSGSGPWPAVIVIHENRGLTDHHKDTARRVANLGYVAFAVDFLSRLGGTAKFDPPGNPTQGINSLKQEDVNADIVSSVAYLKSLSYVRPKFGIVGFCWGGANSLNGALSSKDIVACIVFYGRNPTNIDDVQKLNGPVLGLYGELDTGINSGIPALEAAMKKHTKPFEYQIYTGANHAFFNDSGPRFHEASAKDSWARLVKFYETNLKS